MLSAECGGNDVIDSGDASAEATFDGGTPDAVSDAVPGDRPRETSSEDSQMPEGGTDAESGLNDAEGGSSDAGDASATEADTADAHAGDAEAGSAEAGSAEAGNAEAGSAEAGNADAGAVDAADTSAADGDAGDARVADAGTDADAGLESGALAPPALGTAKSFAVLAASTITNTGAATAIVGDLGIWAGTAYTGLTPGQVTGTIHPGDAVAMQAQADLTTAYNNLAGRPCQHTMTGVDLGGKTLPPGVYCFAASAAQSVGDLTLDGQGDPNAVWIFQIGSTLTISASLSTTVINSGSACNVYWQVGSSATINGGAQLKGNVLVQASVSLLTGANVSPGRVLAQTAAVTMQSNAISNAGCP
jgi:hypothetical protein